MPKRERKNSLVLLNAGEGSIFYSIGHCGSDESNWKRQFKGQLCKFVKNTTEFQGLYI